MPIVSDLVLAIQREISDKQEPIDELVTGTETDHNAEEVHVIVELTGEDATPSQHIEKEGGLYYMNLLSASIEKENLLHESRDNKSFGMKKKITAFTSSPSSLVCLT